MLFVDGKVQHIPERLYDSDRDWVEGRNSIEMELIVCCEVNHGFIEDNMHYVPVRIRALEILGSNAISSIGLATVRERRVKS